MNEEKIEYEKIKANPYGYVRDYMETVLLHIGRKAFSIMALMPGSLILPNIPFGSSAIRSNINLLGIAPAGSGKSTLCKKFSKIAYYPLERRIITQADLFREADSMKLLTIIIEDFSQISSDYETIKIIEGIVEDHKLNKSNMKVKYLDEVKGEVLLFGTPTDLQKYNESLEGGFLSRCMIIFLSLTPKQHSEVGDYINSKIGETGFSEKMKEVENTVISYYQELQQIQEGLNKEINPIKKYLISPDHKAKISKVWKTISERLIEDIGDKYWIRDLQDAYRILIASAFLNIHNRKYENNTLVPNDDDLKIALELMKQNMQYKWAIIKSTALNEKIKSIESLETYLSSGNIPESIKHILINISPYGALLKDKFRDI